MIRTRRTVRASCRIEGLGLHSGVAASVTIHSGEDGIVFLHQGRRIAAIPENVTDTSRCTRLGSVSTVEHLMSALCGLEISDALIEVSGPELPAAGGSATAYMDVLRRAGFEELGDQELPDLFSRIYFGEGLVKIAISKGDGQWRYLYDLLASSASEPDRTDETPSLRRQEAAFQDVVASYAADIAPARTFALEEELPAIRQAGLGKGLDESSALILGVDAYLNPALFPNEPARHKLLDLMGDLYLAGIPARALNVVAELSGHRTNVAAAARLREAVFGP